MIRTIIYDVISGSPEEPLAILTFSGCGFPQKGDNVVVKGERYVVQRKEILVEGISYEVALQVKKYIPENFGF